MPTFQDLLLAEGINPKDVRMLRHAKKFGAAGMSPFAAWQQDRLRFEAYQATQASKYRSFFQAPYWASFVATPAGDTLFVGLYSVNGVEGPVDPFTCPLTGKRHDGRLVDRFTLTTAQEMRDQVGTLFDWGSGARAWRQYADRNVKNQKAD